MEIKEELLTFGPVPSRRLGRSLGINNITPKVCSYACVYCQIGRTIKMKINREEYYSTDTLKRAVEKKLNAIEAVGDRIDYITFVPDGEPTLDINLGRHLKAIKNFGIKTAVITNSSLLWDRNVRDDLENADWVSFKIDAVSDDIWKRIDRPHGKLRLQEILRGIEEFSNSFNGELNTETMIVGHVNDSAEELQKIAEFIAGLNVKTAYISIPTRPPSENWVKPPSEFKLYVGYHIFSEHGINTELLIGYEGNAFSTTGNLEIDLLSITAVHPMREDAVEEYIRKTGFKWDDVYKLVRDGKLVELEYNGKKFYLRRLKD